VITAEKWYDSEPDLKHYYQGDVLSGFPFPTLPTFLPSAKQAAWGILRPRQGRNRPNADDRPLAEILRNLPNELVGRAAKDVPDAWKQADGEYVIVACRKMTVMLVSRSCDIDKDSRKHFLVAPVVAMDQLQPAQRSEEKLRDLRANEIFHWFYLPEKIPGLPESYADISQMVPLHRTFFDDEILRTSLVARLSSFATALFQKALSNFYGTKFGFTREDACPQTGRYACSSCFHAGESTPYSRDFVAGQFFGDCGFCREEALWIKTPPGF
jgi:hypothetical protein